MKKSDNVNFARRYTTSERRSDSEVMIILYYKILYVIAAKLRDISLKVTDYLDDLAENYCFASDEEFQELFKKLGEKL